MVTPNWTLNLPGWLYLGDDPEEQIKGWADKMCADPDFRSEVLAWRMRGRCPVEQGGIATHEKSSAPRLKSAIQGMSSRVL